MAEKPQQGQGHGVDRRARLAGYARALLDTAEDMADELPASPYDMSTSQLRAAALTVSVRRDAALVLRDLGAEQ